MIIWKKDKTSYSTLCGRAKVEQKDFQRRASPQYDEGRKSYVRQVWVLYLDGQARGEYRLARDAKAAAEVLLLSER